MSSDFLRAAMQKINSSGPEVPPGCDTCDANTSMVEASPGVFVLSIAHDNDCPTYLAMQKKAEEQL